MVHVAKNLTLGDTMEAFNFFVLVLFCIKGLFGAEQGSKRFALKPVSFFHIQDFLSTTDNAEELREWMSSGENLEAFISEPEHLVCLLENSYDNFLTIFPLLLQYFSDACSFIDEIRVTIHADMEKLWLPFLKVILQYAKIEDIQAITNGVKLGHLMRTLEPSNLIDAIRKRTAFVKGDPDAQKIEANSMVRSGLCKLRQPLLAVLKSINLQLGFKKVIPEVLFKAIITHYSIPMDDPKLAAPLALIFAWDLLEEVLRNCSHDSLTKRDWLNILISCGHESWERYEIMQAMVPQDVCPKWLVFCNSLAYAGLEDFSERLWLDDEVQASIRTAGGYGAVFYSSSRNVKYLKLCVNEPKFLESLRDELENLSLNDIPSRAVGVALTCKPIKEMVSEKVSSEEAKLQFKECILASPSAPAARIFTECCSFELTADEANALTVQICSNFLTAHGLIYFVKFHWSKLDHFTQTRVLQTFLSHRKPQPLFNLLTDAKPTETTFKLSNMTVNMKPVHRNIIEMVCLFDCILIESDHKCPYFNVDLKLIQIMRESRKDVHGFSERICGNCFDEESYMWAAKYCLFHNNFSLMIQLGLHMLLDCRIEKAYSFASVALEMASFILCCCRGLPSLLIKDMVHIILMKNFEEARTALMAHYRPNSTNQKLD